MDVNTASRSTYCDDESLYLVTGICGGLSVQSTSFICLEHRYDVRIAVSARR